ncbi:MAG TPA: glycosyltransferase family 39 protein, partial [Chloroflexia bacterium]|nr:glycosyltransferase family 39 protein [Chloroflexia bacterium]
FAVFLLTATGFHTYDGISYIRDMGKPLPALVLPHHLIYEPTMLLVFNLWRALGYTGYADLPGEMLSSLAGAGGLALFFSIARRCTESSAVAVTATLVLGLTYGYWFYSVEVDVYVLPLCFLLLAAWLYTRALERVVPPSSIVGLVGAAHGVGALYHQAALFLVPAFALGIYLLPGRVGAKVMRVVAYGFALALVLVPAYFIGGVVVAGQDTPDKFMRWANNYGQLGTWGALTEDTPGNAISGASAAISADYWIGRLLLLALSVVLVLRARPATRGSGPLAWLLWAWLGTYTVFFTWWQPEVLKFWVLVLPPALLLILLSFRWGALAPGHRHVAIAAGTVLVLLLSISNVPTIWAKRDAMSDPGRRMSAALSQLSAPEDLLVLQSGSAEHYLPFMYGRINVMSTRELWYLWGPGGEGQAVANIRQRMWHALAKGSSVWIEDRALAPGVRTSDHYVFSGEQIDSLLSPYGPRAEGDKVRAGDAVFTRLSPGEVFSPTDAWTFTTDQAGWSGVNLVGETLGEQGWCFYPAQDPNLYGPPVRLRAANYSSLSVTMTAGVTGRGQFFYKQRPEEPYAETASVEFEVRAGAHNYVVPLGGEWSNLQAVEGLRLDPVEGGSPSEGAINKVCVEEIRLLP